MSAKDELQKGMRTMVRYILPEDAREDDIINNYANTFMVIAETYHHSVLLECACNKVSASDNAEHETLAGVSVPLPLEKIEEKASEYVDSVRNRIDDYAYLDVEEAFKKGAEWMGNKYTKRQ